MKYRKKPVVIEAVQWDGTFPNDANVLRWTFMDKKRCKECNVPLEAHGRVETLEGYHIACPKDWIITGVKGEIYPCKPDIFEMTYDRVT